MVDMKAGSDAGTLVQYPAIFVWSTLPFDLGSYLIGSQIGEYQAMKILGLSGRKQVYS